MLDVPVVSLVFENKFKMSASELKLDAVVPDCELVESDAVVEFVVLEPSCALRAASRSEKMVFKSLISVFAEVVEALDPPDALAARSVASVFKSEINLLSGLDPVAAVLLEPETPDVELVESVPVEDESVDPSLVELLLICRRRPARLAANCAVCDGSRVDDDVVEPLLVPLSVEDVSSSPVVFFRV